MFPDYLKEYLQIFKNENVIDLLKELKVFFNNFHQNKVLIFVGFQIVQVIISPIPGQLMAIVGGYIFGAFWGLIWTMLGLMLGSTMAIIIGRLIGQNIVKYFFPKVYAKFKKNILKNSYTNIFIIYLLPLFPDDAICFILGLSKFSLLPLLFILFIGRLPGILVYSIIGDNLIINPSLSLILFIASMFLSLIIWLNQNKIESILKIN